jgi:signal transduction histidine kinase
MITDTGIGIPREEIPHIFEPFFTTKEGEAGLGLGLAVTYGIVQRHSGHISVDSQPEKGTTFTIRLPREPAVEREEVLS